MRDLSDTEIARLQALLDERAAAAPAGAPLDVSALDGYLCGVLLQPSPVPERDWWPFDAEAAGRTKGPAPNAAPGAAAAPGALGALAALVHQRHAVLAEAIAARRWFDPWIFELDGTDTAAVHATADAEPGDDDHDDGEKGAAPASVRESLLPWVAGFALAVERFPALLRHDERALAEPLALLYQHFDADDLEGLEDEPALAEALADAEPPADMTEAAEDLVRAVLLLADVSRPQPRPPRTAPARASPGPGPRSRNGRPARARRG